MQPFDDVAAFSERTQPLLGIRSQNPARRTGWLGETQPFERPHPANPNLPQRIARGVTVGTKIDDPLGPSRFPGKCSVEPCPAFCGNLSFKAAPNIEFER